MSSAIPVIYPPLSRKVCRTSNKKSTTMPSPHLQWHRNRDKRLAASVVQFWSLRSPGCFRLPDFPTDHSLVPPPGRFPELLVFRLRLVSILPQLYRQRLAQQLSLHQRKGSHSDNSLDSVRKSPVS